MKPTPEFNQWFDARMAHREDVKEKIRLSDGNDDIYMAYRIGLEAGYRSCLIETKEFIKNDTPNPAFAPYNT